MGLRRTLAALFLTIAFIGARASAQTPQVTVPPDGELGLLHFTFEWGKESPLGSLRDVILPDSALELRVWSGFGLTGTRGLVLQRSAKGEWVAKRVVVVPCFLSTREREPISEDRLEQLRREARRKCPQEVRDGTIIPADTLVIYPLSLPPQADSIWSQVLGVGLDTIPTHDRREEVITGRGVRVTWDGYHHVLEYRRGSIYRASVAAGPVQRLVTVLRAAFAWER